MSYLKKYWVKYRWLFILSVSCVCGEAVCDLMQPRLMKGLIDNGAAKGDLHFVLHQGLLMLGILGVGAAFAMTRNITSAIASQSFGAELRRELFVKIQAMHMDDFDLFQGGSLVTRETSDVTQLQNFTNGLMRIFFKAPIMCIGAIIMAALLDVKSLIITLPVVALVSGIIALSMKTAYPRFFKVQTALDQLNVRMREYLTGIRLVKAFRRFREEEERFAAANDELAGNTIKANRVLAIFSPFMALFVNLGIGLALLLGARWIGAGKIQVGSVMAFITYFTQILTSLNMLSNMLNAFVRVQASHQRIAAVLNIDTDYPDGSQRSAGAVNTPVNAQTLSGREYIVFEQVGFKYKGATGQPALTDISFSLARGETLGVIGSTGSGKSTLCALLLRLYSAGSGKIKVDGAPLDHIPTSEWREQIALVPQTAMLFSGTIKENILWGRGDAGDDEIKKASDAAQASEFITSLPAGYDTVIGQSGANLSGGQKQRVSIARALIRNPAVLVLDDCTSALDMITEAKVKRALKEYQLTCVLVTQRISTAMSCDRILVLDSGRQVGLGAHEELLRTCAEYGDIYRSQIGEGAARHG